NLLDGRRNTREIIDESLLGKFNTCKILSELLQAGYITKAAPPAAAPAGALIAMITQKFSAAIHYAALVLVLFMVMLLPTSFPENILPLLNPKEVKVKSPLYQLINIQSILLDVLRMIDEWPDVKRLVPSFEMTFQPVPGSFPADLADDGLLVYNL
ncbi:MAG: hypothetical protein NTV89_02025, partial [Proteobacteria bacterium]|nr:hypothetical protein [Pseudomonadota bacterium]